MRGKDAGKQGEVLSIVNKENSIRVVVKGINIVKKTQKPNPQLGIVGGMSEKEMSLDISNVMVLDKKTGKPVRVKFKIDEKTGKKSRVSAKTGEVI